MNVDTEETGLMARLRARVRGFHGDEQGQSIVYLVLIMFLLACFTFMVINSGTLLHDKMQAQSAADAAAMSGSTWMVRAMNLNSMMNIFLAMLLAEEIMMKAVFWTALTALLLAPAIEAFWLGVCLTTGTCNPAIDVVIDTFDLFPLLWETEDHEDFLWDVMEAISDVEEVVDTAMPVVGVLESFTISLRNGAGFGMMYPPTLPTEQGELQDLCETTLSGSVGGYNEVQYSVFGSLTNAIGSISGFNYDDEIRNIASGILTDFLGLEGPLWGELQIPYHLFWARTAPYHFTNIMFAFAVAARYAVMCGGSLGDSSRSFSIPAAWWCFFCDDNEISIPNPAAYLGAAFAFLDSGNPNVQPFILADDWEEKKNYWGFAYKTPEDIQARFIPDFFTNSFGDELGMITVAQAQIYNPHVEGGMFSPHWRTHLHPVQLNPDEASAAGGFASTGPFAEADPSAIGGMLGVIDVLASTGIDELFAH